jgi:hypothetical protein
MSNPMFDNEISLTGIIYPKVSAAELIQAWKDRPEAGLSPDISLVTNGQTFELKVRATWPIEDIKHTFWMVVQKVSNLKGDGWGSRVLWPDEMPKSWRTAGICETRNAHNGRLWHNENADCKNFRILDLDGLARAGRGASPESYE